MPLSYPGRLILVLLAAALAGGCAAPDPKAQILVERARWDVRIVSWAQDPTGGLNVGTMVSGPTRARIRQLTVRFDLLDAAGTRLAERWHSFDLTQVPRGTPTEFLVRLEGPGAMVEGLVVSRVLEPDAEEQRRMGELQLDSD